MNYEDVRQKAVGEILHDEVDEGLRFIIMRGPVSLCAYIGVPLDHPLAGHSYEDLPVRAHGGLTFASKANDRWPEGYFWYGWDYAHSGDYCFFVDEPPIAGMFDHSADHKWTVEEVKEDSWSALYDFKRLMKLSEAIAKAEGK